MTTLMMSGKSRDITELAVEKFFEKNIMSS